jgi:predicted 3-demethylubiquinone-9 3-methyltransferase (glyoxalase superfamily)
LNGEPFIAMDSSQSHAFTFNEAISLLIDCDSQEEVDYFWQKLSEHSDPTTQQCGWLKDQFGVFWQVNPAELRRILQDPDVDKVARVTEAFLQMKKLDMNELRKVYNGR